MKRAALLCSAAALTGCADVSRSVLYPESLSVVVRSGNRTQVDGVNFGLQWKLKPREVVTADR